MMAGAKLDVFTPLKDGQMSAAQIADAIEVDTVKLGPLLYALVVAGLLNVDGDLFSNTAEADHYLVRDRPDYMGETLDFYLELWEATLKTAESIRTGKPQAMHDYTTMPEDELESFLRGMYPNTASVGRALAESYDFSSSRTLLDVGGGSGGLSIAMIEAVPGLRATIVDLPTTTPITQRIVAEAGAAGRIQVMTADVVQGPLSGSFDAAVLKGFVNILSPEQNRKALRNISQVMNPGGTLYIVGGLYLNNSRLTPAYLSLFNTTLLSLYEHGQLYTEEEHEEWLTEAGFVDVQHVPGMGFVARKPEF